MNVSVVIPAHNEATALVACLDALVKQKTQYHFETVIVDNASTDQTAAVAQMWQKKLKLHIVQEPAKGAGAARRRGFAAANSDIILSTDADSIVPTDLGRGFDNSTH